MHVTTCSVCVIATVYGTWVAAYNIHGSCIVIINVRGIGTTSSMLDSYGMSTTRQNSLPHP